MNLKLKVIPPAGSFLIRCLGYSWRITEEGATVVERVRENSPNVIYAHWHGRLLPLGFTHRNRSIHVLTSAHSDGEMLGRTVKRLGYGYIRGSSTRGGSRAIRELVRKLESGFDVGIGVDGPRGPRYEVKPGVIQIARMSGAPVIPITNCSRRRKVFSSWDAFELPCPFTEVLVRYGDPVVVPADADTAEREVKRLELESKLRALTEEGDAYFHG